MFIQGSSAHILFLIEHQWGVGRTDDILYSKGDHETVWLNYDLQVLQSRYAARAPLTPVPREPQMALPGLQADPDAEAQGGGPEV
jgi:hypothetical protein